MSESKILNKKLNFLKILSEGNRIHTAYRARIKPEDNVNNDWIAMISIL